MGNKKVNKKEYRKNNTTETRLEYIVKKFNVFEDDLGEDMIAKNREDLELNPLGVKLIPVYDSMPTDAGFKSMSGNLIAIQKISPIKKSGQAPYIEYMVSETVFTNILIADPTENKSNVQWMLQTFVNDLATNKIEAIRFVSEDLGLANTYLTLFEAHKKKKRFKEWAIKNEYRKWKVKNPNKSEEDWLELGYNPSDITQYKSLSQLFDAVDPFRERSHSDLEDAMNRFVNLGEAEIDYRDRFWTVFIPKTKSANCVMENFAGWCTAQPSQGMFDHYVTSNRIPNGERSKIYVIVNNDLFEGKSDETYQIHFESGQIKDKQNGANVDLYDLIFSQPNGEGIHEYFHSVLDELARMDKNNVNNNKYIKQLIEFGFSDSLFDYLDEDTDTIAFNNQKIPKLPDLSRFKNVDQVLILSTGLREIHPSLFNITKLNLLSLSENKLTSLPSGIGKLKNLDLLNIKGNPITSVPDEIAELDKTRGGNLYRLSVDVNDVGEEVFNRLRELLPSVVVDS